MSSRYDDSPRARSTTRRAQDERDYDDRDYRNDREAGRGLRQDVRETGRAVRDAGGDILSSWCGLWGNFLISIGEVIASPSRPAGQGGRGYSRSDSRSDSRYDSYPEEHDSLSCGGAEACFICSVPGAGAGQQQQGPPPRTSDAGGEGRTTARYADRDREIDVTT